MCNIGPTGFCINCSNLRKDNSFFCSLAKSEEEFLKIKPCLPTGKIYVEIDGERVLASSLSNQEFENLFGCDRDEFIETFENNKFGRVGIVSIKR